MHIMAILLKLKTGFNVYKKVFHFCGEKTLGGSVSPSNEQKSWHTVTISYIQSCFLQHDCTSGYDTQQFNNNVWTPSLLFPLFSAHLIKLGAADRTAGLLMITFSRCPLEPSPLTFPSEENSRWTATAPSQMPFLLIMPQQTCQTAKQAHAQTGAMCNFKILNDSF